ncbi:MAG: lytic murein transglycosylase [Pseudomonadota bacterium]
MLKVFQAAGLCAAVMLAAPVAAQDQPFEQWRDGFTAELAADGVSPDIITSMFEGVTPDERIIDRDRSQPEFVRPVWVYLDSAVSETRIANGRSSQSAHLATLAAIEERFGVDRHTLTAIWGLESAYGEIQGNFDIVRALATLAWEGRRRGFAESQLSAVADMLARGYATRDGLRGSWAGAMGQTQFIPTTYMARAVDFDGDGRRDIWNNEGDALGSAANLLAREGWRSGEPAVTGVALPDGFDYASWNERRAQPVSEWARIGVRRADGSDWSADDLMRSARLILPAGAAGPGFLTFHNFGVIRRYNNSTSYALGVAYLAEALANGERLPESWPDDNPPITRSQTRALQEALLALGYDPGGADGISGPNTRRALKAFQTDRGLPADGYTGEQAYAAVMAAR